MRQQALDTHSSGTRALQRAARHFVRKAAHHLASSELSDGLVHDTRKELKKSRTALRLLRAELGESVYHRENAVLRIAAQSLNAVRDANVLVQTLETLRRGNGVLKDDAAVAHLSRTLRAEQSAVHQQLQAHGGSLSASRRALERTTHRVAHWQLGKHGWSVLGPAFKRIYKNGRRALPSAGALPADADLHEWRKQVKYLRYALQMLRPMRRQALPALEQQARSLAECLGETHDLALLAKRAQALGAKPHTARVQPLLSAINRRRERLTLNALAAGARLYRRRPRELGLRFAGYWREWRQQAPR